MNKTLLILSVLLISSFVLNAQVSEAGNEDGNPVLSSTDTSTVVMAVDTNAGGAGGHEVLNQHDLDVLLNGAADLQSLSKMLVDTVPYFAFGAGSGQSKDTAIFANGMYGGGFYHAADSFKVTSVRSFLLAGTGTEALTFQVFWGTSQGTAQDSLFTAAVAVNTHTGESDVPSRNGVIKPRCYVWGVYRGVTAGNKPSFVSSTIVGYIKRD